MTNKLYNNIMYTYLNNIINNVEIIYRSAADAAADYNIIVVIVIRSARIGKN